MIKNKLASLVAIVGLAISFNASAMNSQFDLNDDYDVAMVNNAKTLGQLNVNEEISLNSPDDYNVTEVYKSKTIRNAKATSHSSLDNIDDY